MTQNNPASISTVLNEKRRYAIGFFIIFYAVGILGLAVPETYPLFVRLTPLAIVLSTIALIYYHPHFTPKGIAVFLSIAVMGYFIEVYGVNTGLLFGHYTYGAGLGKKIFNTPLIIGLNWLMLIYISAAILENLKVGRVAKVLLASLIMLFYDVVVEQIAPAIDMWEFQAASVPIQNYAAWFFIAVFFHTLVKLFRIPTKNRLAGVILCCQLLFFLILFIIFKTIN